MQTKIKIGSKLYRVEISELDENLLRVKVDGNDYFFSKNELGELVPVVPQGNEELRSLLREEVFLEALAEKEIKSPIAGTISTIEEKEGEALKPGQKVVTLKAMKMENEKISETVGIVEAVKIKEGQFVNAGDVLIVLK